MGGSERKLLLAGEFTTLTNWHCTNGGEFPGAKGSIGAVTADDQRTLKLDYDFSGGGNYVGAVYSGGFPVETTGLAFTARAEKACNLFCRVSDGNKTFQGFYRKLKAGEEATAQISVNGPWRNSWGRGNATRPEPPIRELWICVQHENPLAVDLITGKSFDVPIKVDDDDLTIDLLLTDNPLVIKMFPDISDDAQ